MDCFALQLGRHARLCRLSEQRRRDAAMCVERDEREGGWFVR
jgi:hypothetical protein